MYKYTFYFTHFLRQADGSYIIPHPTTANKKTGLYTSRSELFMTLGQIHFDDEGRLNVRCEATIGGEAGGGSKAEAEAEVRRK